MHGKRHHNASTPANRRSRWSQSPLNRVELSWQNVPKSSRSIESKRIPRGSIVQVNSIDFGVCRAC